MLIPGGRTFQAEGMARTTKPLGGECALQSQGGAKSSGPGQEGEDPCALTLALP